MMRDDLDTVADALVKVIPDVGGHGSGTLINLGQKRGLVLTCHHVVVGAQSVCVEIGREEYEAKLMASNPAQDLALLGIDVAGLPALDVSNSAPKSREELCVGGYPHDMPCVVVEGRFQTTLRLEGFRFPLYLITAGGIITPGISGGAVTDARAELVGVVTRMHHVEEIPMFGIGYAIPLTQIRKFLRRVQETGKSVSTDEAVTPTQKMPEHAIGDTTGAPTGVPSVTPETSGEVVKFDQTI